MNWLYRSVDSAWRTGRLLLCLLPLLLLLACSSHSRLPPLPAGSPVLVLGDSVSHGTGAAAGQDYPTLLAHSTGWNITNAGVPGDTSAGARARLDGLLDEVRPVLVIVEIGGNDFLQRRGVTAVREDVAAIIARCRQKGARVVLVGVPLPGVPMLLKDAPFYEELADQEGVLLVPSLLADILGDSALRADPIHPNAAGYQVLADGLVEALRDAGWLSKP